MSTARLQRHANKLSVRSVIVPTKSTAASKASSHERNLQQIPDAINPIASLNDTKSTTIRRLKMSGRSRYH